MSGSVFSVLFFSTIVTLCELTEPENCTLKANLPCMLYRLKDDACSPPQLQARFPDMYINTDSNPGPAFDFSASIYYNVFLHNGENRTYPCVNLTFTPPGDGSISLLKGFEIMQSRANSPSRVWCYIFDMSNASWSAENDKHVLFTLPISPIMHEMLYLYDLYTLPKPDPQFDQSKTIELTAPKYEDTPIPGKWATIISYTAIHEYNMVLTNFEPPPDEFGFQEFYITLWNAGEKKFFVRDKEVSDPRYVFEGVTPGIYQIWVQPVDPYLYVFDKCVCKDAIDGCDACVTSKSQNFTLKDIPVVVTKATTETPQTTEEESPRTVQTKEPSDSPTPTEKVLIIVFACLAGVLLVLVVAVFYWLRCRPEKYAMKPKDINHNVNDGFDPEVASVVTVEYLKKGGNLDKYNNVNANKVQFEKRKKLFILYEEDHKFHRLVIDKFATYLSVDCQCDVEQAELQHDAPWVHQDLAQADYIVIVNSEAAYKAYMSSSSQKTSGKNPSVSSINSIRNRFMREEKYDHIIMVYFSYTEERFILPDICTGYKYKVMKHFTDFLLHVHRLHRTDNLSRYDLPFDGNHILRPIGQELLMAIEQSAKFEAENPNWHIQMHGMTRGISNISQESHHLSGDSGCPDDYTPLPTPIPGHTDPWSKVNSNRPIDSKSVVTVKESDLNSNGHYPNFIPKNASKQRPPLRLSIAKPNGQDQSNVQESNVQDEPKVFSPPTDSPSDFEFDFVPPECNSNFDALSHTQSRQLEVIVNQYTEILKGQGDWKGSPKGQREGEGHYDKEADLAMLDAHSREVMFNSAMEGDTISLGSVGGVSM